MITFDNVLDEHFFAVPTLKNIDRYDFDRCEEKVKKTIQRFIDLQIEYSKIEPPRITRSYEVVYSNNKKNNKSDNIGDFVTSKLTTEEEIIKFYNYIYNALTRLNQPEMVYFTEALYCGKSDSRIAEEKLISVYKVKSAKKSCIIKLAKSLGIAVYKENAIKGGEIINQI